MQKEIRCGADVEKNREVFSGFVFHVRSALFRSLEQATTLGSHYGQGRG